MRCALALFCVMSLGLIGQTPSVPHPIPGGFELPNGWRLTPVGRHAVTNDYVLNVSTAPDGKNVVALHSGFQKHGLVMIDPLTAEITQKIPLKSAWLGLAWSPDGKKLFVSGGNANSRVQPTAAPIYIFSYEKGKLSEQPVGLLEHRLPTTELYWSGLAAHPTKPLLYAANRGTGTARGQVVVFNTESQQRVAEILVDVVPYAVVLDAKHNRLYASNWSSQSVSVIDTNSNKVVGTIRVGHNPNDMVLSKEGLLYVACSNENSVYVIDTAKGRPVQVISTAMYKNAPVGSTPDALVLDKDEKFLFVANADNNNIAVINVGELEESTVLGFIPTTWYPSSLTLAKDGKTLVVGSSKGLGGMSDERGPHSPIAKDGSTEGLGSVKSLQKGSVSLIPLGDLKSKIKEYTRQAMANSPYNNEQLAMARGPVDGVASTVVPRQVGGPSPIKHVIYILRENRTYDQILGDLGKGNGDPRLTVFGKNITPNVHQLVQDFVLLDNLYCDGEVSVDGHSWSNSAYATDFNEKLWPVTYGGHSQASASAAYVPSSGHLWDLAAAKGLTYRSYGEYAARTSEGGQMDAAPGVGGLVGHVAPKFRLQGMRDTDNVREFIREFDQYEANYESDNPNKRLPNYIVMSLGEDHTQGTRPGGPTPRSSVANNDWAIGQLVERVSHSKYWKETAIFIIEDDAQDGADHVDARRTVGLVISPYTKRQAIDSTLYTTSSMLRTMELMLGLPPMTQYDAAAMPMYASFTDTPDMTPYEALAPMIDVNEKNTMNAWGAKKSMEMDFSDYDRTPMFALNEIIWKSVKGADSEMPLPVRRFHFRQ